MVLSEAVPLASLVVKNETKQKVSFFGSKHVQDPVCCDHSGTQSRSVTGAGHCPASLPSQLQATSAQCPVQIFFFLKQSRYLVLRLF